MTMITVEGVVSKIWANDIGESKFKPGERSIAYAIVVGEDRFSAGFKKPAANEGDEVQVIYDAEDKYKKIQTLAIVKKGDGGGSATPSSVASSKRPYRHNGEEGGFPVHPLAYERTLDRRNAVASASAIVAAGIGKGFMKEGAPFTRMVLDMAKEFEAYTTGDVDKAMAEKAMSGEDV